LQARGWLVSPTDEDWDRAWAAYRRDKAGGAGIVDHVSFEVMRRLGVNHAFTNDQHFRAAGFETLF
jgi:predicted nucleic acid-binding protein